MPSDSRVSDQSFTNIFASIGQQIRGIRLNGDPTRCAIRPQAAIGKRCNLQRERITMLQNAPVRTSMSL